MLFPRPLKNPEGTKPIGTSHLQREMRAWVSALPRLDGSERDAAGRPIPFPREQVIPYAFRHSFAQRHADAGTPVDTLKELLGHDTVRTTLGYYRVTARRKRAAQDALGPLQLDAGGRRVRPGGRELLPAEALREQIGQVAVPFGICTEPSNVSANGGSCPFRHRCFGCDLLPHRPLFTSPSCGAISPSCSPTMSAWPPPSRPADRVGPGRRRALRRGDRGGAPPACSPTRRCSPGSTTRNAPRVETAIATARTQRAPLSMPPSRPSSAASPARLARRCSRPSSAPPSTMLAMAEPGERLVRLRRADSAAKARRVLAVLEARPRHRRAA